MYTRYSDELIEEIRINNDIVDVVSEYVRLEKRGKNYFGLCPFHREKTPSFSVESGKQIFYCFGCGKGGNVFQFVSLAEKLDYIESVRLLADRAKIVLPESDDTEQAEKAKLKQLVLNINLITARYYNDVLNSRHGEPAAAYLKKREISGNTVRKFGIGYSTDEWDNLYQHLRSEGFDDEQLLQSGLVLKSSKSTLYDRFKGRLIFPIFDVRGNVLGFGGRVLDNSLPKYVNSPETPVYSKGKHLYALNFAKNSDSKKLIVVEGYMDVISLHQSGINNVVASLGTALTDSQGRILKKYADEIVISYDADTAGQAATQRGLDLLNEMGCSVKVLTVPDGKDPDEYIRKNGPDGFKKLVDSALSLVEYKIKVLRSEQDLTATEGKIAFLNKAAIVLSKVDNIMEREMYIKKLSREYEISEDAILSEVMRRTKPAAKQSLKIANAVEAARKVTTAGDEIDEKLLHDERLILSLLCVDNSTYKTVKENFNTMFFTSAENTRVAELVFSRLENRRDFTPAELLDAVNPEDTGKFARILKEECYCDDNRRAILGKIRDIGVLKAEKRQKQILEQLNDKSKLSEGDVDKLKQELKDMTQKMNNIKGM
jgi:DNA primase